ncbi:MAG TPA: HD domain-containing phosphohydrolase, partial [Gallionella sp.]|nr:HD domain-containing phosphohydrolase [Gallionella sp.]
VTELGDTRKVVAHRDIVSENGIKLVASGVYITSKLHERLVKHRLQGSLDMSLSAENMVDTRVILDDLQALVRKKNGLKKLVEIIDKETPLRQVVLFIRFPVPLAFKLTVAREKFPRIYRRSLILLVISLYLARCDGMALREEENVVTAALFQDVGLMHIDPKLLDPAYVMSDDERNYLYAHPLMACLLLREFPEVPKQVSEAVLEHHERMDGRGYPRSLPGDKISRYGQILAVAELFAKAFDTDDQTGQWKKLGIMLKLSSRQYGRRLIGYLARFRDDTGVAPVACDPAHLIAQIRQIAKLFEAFERHADIHRGGEIFDFAHMRLAKLKLDLFDAGFDHRDPEATVGHFADDPWCMDEYLLLLNEAFWQFRLLMSDISRRWGAEIDGGDAPAASAKHAWLHEMKALVAAAPRRE